MRTDPTAFWSVACPQRLRPSACGRAPWAPGFIASVLIGRPGFIDNVPRASAPGVSSVCPLRSSELMAAWLPPLVDPRNSYALGSDGGLAFVAGVLPSAAPGTIEGPRPPGGGGGGGGGGELAL